MRVKVKLGEPILVLSAEEYNAKVERATKQIFEENKMIQAGVFDNIGLEKSK